MAMQPALVVAIFHYRRYAANVVQVLHHVFAAWLHISQNRYAVAYRLEIILC